MTPITQAKSKQSPAILIAIAIAGLLGGYFYYSQVLKESIPPVRLPAISAGDTLAKFKDLKFDFSIFDDARFKSLKIFGESPVQPGASGRTDLFAPF